MTEEELKQFHQLAMDYRGTWPSFEATQMAWADLVNFVNAMLAKRESHG